MKMINVGFSLCTFSELKEGDLFLIIQEGGTSNEADRTSMHEQIVAGVQPPAAQMFLLEKKETPFGEARLYRRPDLDMKERHWHISPDTTCVLLHREPTASAWA